MAIPRVSSNLHPVRHPYLPERLYLSGLRSIQGGGDVLGSARVLTILFLIVVGFVGLLIVHEHVLEGHALLRLQAARTLAARAPATRPWSWGADWTRGRKSTALRGDRQTGLVQSVGTGVLAISRRWQTVRPPSRTFRRWGTTRGTGNRQFGGGAFTIRARWIRWRDRMTAIYRESSHRVVVGRGILSVGWIQRSAYRPRRRSVTRSRPPTLLSNVFLLLFVDEELEQSLILLRILRGSIFPSILDTSQNIFFADLLCWTISNRSTFVTFIDIDRKLAEIEHNVLVWFIEKEETNIETYIYNTYMSIWNQWNSSATCHG